jgi:membrane protein YqaA with SNARE-associated domain
MRRRALFAPSFLFIDGAIATTAIRRTLSGQSMLRRLYDWTIYHAYEQIAKPVLEMYGKLDTFEQLRGTTSADAILLMLITSGLAHLPPIKVVTILSGAAGVNIWLFIASAIVARGARFFFLAWLLRRYGEPIRHFIEKRLGLIASAVAVLLIALFFAVKYLHA